jgi:hypothetical protein
MSMNIVRILALWVLAALGGCANLDAVRDFSATSAQLGGYREVTRQYLSSPGRRLREIPPDPLFAEQKASIEATTRDIAAQKESLATLQSLASGYMTALATLAGDDTIEISDEVDKVSGAVRAFPDLGISAAHVDAVGALARTVTRWTLAARQARDVKTLVQQYGEPMDAVLEAMESVLRSCDGVLRQEHASIEAYNEAKLAYWARPSEAEAASPELSRRHLLVRTLAQRSWDLIQAEQRRVDAAVAAARKGVAAVREGHRVMRENIARLSSAEMKGLLRQASADLRAARSQIATL